MGTKFVNKEEIVSGTRSEDSVTLRLSFLIASVHMKMYSFICLSYLFFLSVKKNFLQHDHGMTYFSPTLIHS